MKYEFIFKIKESRYSGYEVKYRTVVSANRYNSVKASYDLLQKSHPDWDSVILINELTDFNEFVRTIQ